MYKLRRKDDSKRKAIFEATISLLNEIGFYQISMSKIAKRAGVSVATIYVYFEDKDDMIRKLYFYVKNQFVTFTVQDLDSTKSVQQNIEHSVRKMLNFILRNKEYFLFIEQFLNSPLVQNLSIEDNVEDMKAFYRIFEIGKKDGVLKPVESILLMGFCYSPVMDLAKSHFNGNLELSEDVVKSIILMSWDAIKA